VKKSEWRRALAYLYDEHIGRHLPRWYRRPHPLEYADERYLLERLGDAIDIVQFADRHPDAAASRRLRSDVSTIAGAGRRVIDLDQRTGLATLLAEHRRLIASELDAEDLPPHDRQFLDEAGVRNPDMELELAVQRLKERASSSAASPSARPSVHGWSPSPATKPSGSTGSADAARR